MTAQGLEFMRCAQSAWRLYVHAQPVSSPVRQQLLEAWFDACEMALAEYRRRQGEVSGRV
jgi:hypothetical protein